MRIRLFTTAMAICLLWVAACKKGSSTAATGQYKGKVTLMACGTAAIDIEVSINPGGVNPAVNSSSTISVTNYCYLVEKGIQTGDTVTFNISKENTQPGQPCVVTQCYINPPGTPVFITDVQKDK